MVWLVDLFCQCVIVLCGDDRVILFVDVVDLVQVLVENFKVIIVVGVIDVGLWVIKFLCDIFLVVFIGYLQDLKYIQIMLGQISIGVGVIYLEFEFFIL